MFINAHEETDHMNPYQTYIILLQIYLEIIKVTMDIDHHIFLIYLTCFFYVFFAFDLNDVLKIDV